MKRGIQVIMTFLLLTTLMTAQVAYANNPNNNGNGQEKGQGKAHAPGQLKKVDRYTAIDRDRIKVNDNPVCFDTPPVIQDGRTLVPLRAVTEALGCEVVWESPMAYVISAEVEIIIVFDLSIGAVYVAEDWDLDDLMDLDDDDDEWEDMEVEIDTAPGLIDGRTFVPLRFISEILGLGIGYDVDSGMIDIYDGPELDPMYVEIDDYDDLPEEIEIDIDLNDFDFVGIDGLEEDEDYTTDDDLTITLLEDYIESLDDEKTKLKLMFENDSVEVTKVFKVILEYMDEMPELDPEEATIDEDDDDLEIEVEMDLNDYTLEDIYYDNDELDEGDKAKDDYSLNNDGDEVTFNESFLEDLDVGDHELIFEFERGSKVVEIEFEIEVEE